MLATSSADFLALYSRQEDSIGLFWNSFIDHGCAHCLPQSSSTWLEWAMREPEIISHSLDIVVVQFAIHCPRSSHLQLTDLSPMRWCRTVVIKCKSQIEEIVSRYFDETGWLGTIWLFSGLHSNPKQQNETKNRSTKIVMSTPVMCYKCDDEHQGNGEDGKRDLYWSHFSSPNSNSRPHSQ